MWKLKGNIAGDEVEDKSEAGEFEQEKVKVHVVVKQVELE